MTDLFILTLISGILVAAASGLVGSFLVLRKMTLLSDALSHVALPGIALGIIFKFQPLLGGLAFLFLGVLLIWQIENKTKLAIESVTGVLFVTALSAGSILIPQSELLETFFGSVEKITLGQIIIQTILALIVIGLAIKYLKPLTLSSIAPDLAIAAKVSKTKMELLLLILIAFTIAMGISFVGVLLMSALLIVPAAAARNISANFKTFVGLSVILALISLVGGLAISNFYAIEPGIATVLVSALIFAFSFLAKK